MSATHEEASAHVTDVLAWAASRLAWERQLGALHLVADRDPPRGAHGPESAGDEAPVAWDAPNAHLDNNRQAWGRRRSRRFKVRLRPAR